MRKSTKIILLCVALAAFALRVQICRELIANDPQTFNPASCTDMWTYRSLSNQILNGTFTKEYYYQPFYYAVFLPFLKLAFGAGIWPVVIAQCILSAVAVWLAGAAAAKLWGRTAGTAAAILAAFSTTLALYNAFYLIAPLQTFWIALLAFLCVSALDRRSIASKQTIRRWLEWAGIGFVGGLAILTRGNVWFLIPGVLVAAALAEPATDAPSPRPFAGRAGKLIPAALCLLMILLPQLPFAWRNTAIKGTPTGPSTAAGAVLCLGDTPESPPGGREAGSGAGPMEYPETCQAWSAGGSGPATRRVLRWAWRQPLAFLELQFRKCLLFWDFREIPNNVALETDGLKSPTLRMTGLLPTLDVKTPFGPRPIIFLNIVPSTILLLILGLAGFILAFLRLAAKIAGKRRVRAGEALLLYFVTAYWLGTAAFYILARFRAPVYPLLAIFAGGFVFHSKQLLTRRRKLGEKAAVAAVLAALFSGFVVLTAYDFYRRHCESKILSWVRPDGTSARLRGSAWLVMDNGPATFGGWRALKVGSGTRVVKTFVPPEPLADALAAGTPASDFTAVVKLTLFWASPGSCHLTINGKAFRIRSPRAARREVREFEIPFPENGVVEMFFSDLDGDLLLFLDAQRDYSRTQVDGATMNSELVAALRIKHAVSK